MGENLVEDGDLTEIIGRKRFRHIIRIKKDQEIQSDKGIIKTNDLIGKSWGSVIKSHTGNTFFILQPSLNDILKMTPRNTQIIYPKDIGFILLSLNIGNGSKVIEAGTGSGAFTTALANTVGNEGKIFSYEARPEFQKIAINNLKNLGFDKRVEFKIRNIENGFDENNVDALFLDLPDPYNYIKQARKALKSGGFLGCILPTENQVVKLLQSLKSEGFAFTEVCEILLRYYRADPDRFRPSDRMTGHTGFLIFSRMLSINPGEKEKSDFFAVEQDDDAR